MRHVSNNKKELIKALFITVTLYCYQLYWMPTDIAVS